jgi:hypothetical protein
VEQQASDFVSIVWHEGAAFDDRLFIVIRLVGNPLGVDPYSGANHQESDGGVFTAGSQATFTQVGETRSS